MHSQICFILCLFRERLIESSLVGPGIDLHEKIAFLDHLALFEGDLGNLAVNAAAHSHGDERFHGAEPVQIDWEICRFHLGDGDRDGREHLTPFSLSRRCRANSVAVNVKPAEITTEGDNCEDNDKRPSAAEW